MSLFLNSTQNMTEKLFNRIKQWIEGKKQVLLNVLLIYKKKCMKSSGVMESFCFFCFIQGTKEKLMFPSTVVVVAVFVSSCSLL